MKTEKNNRQVIAIILTILIAFAAVVWLVFNMSFGLIQNHFENMTNLCTSAVEDDINQNLDIMERLLKTVQSDASLKSAAQVKKTTGSEEEIQQVLLSYQNAYPDFKLSFTSLQDAQTDTYDSWMQTFIQSGSADTKSFFTSTYQLDKTNNVLTSASLLKDQEGNTIGVLSTATTADEILNVIHSYRNNYGIKVSFIQADGTVLLSEKDMADQNVFAQGGSLFEHQDILSSAKAEAVKQWLNRGSVFGKNQSFCEVSYIEHMDAYLLIVNDSPVLFDNQRQQMATLVVIISVVLVLVTLMVINIVQKYRSKIIQIATTDQLTGLTNRKSFMSGFDSLQEAEKLEHSVIFLLDIDFFKKINDSYGHLIGDQALSAVGAEVKQLTAEHGIAGRWGGDEFIGILTKEEKEPYVKIQEMIQKIANQTLPGEVKLTVSVGAAVIQKDQTINQIVEMADEALYQSKKNGRGFLTIYQEGATPKVSYEEHNPSLMKAGQPCIEKQKDAETAQIPETKHSSGSAKKIFQTVIDDLIFAVNGMIPFVAGGGILIAIAFLIDGASVDIGSLSAEMRASFGSITPLANALFTIGSTTFNFMLPIFSAYLSYKISGKEGIAAGFIGGYLSAKGSAGFAGAILAGFFVGYIVRQLKDFMKEVPGTLTEALQILIYPLISLLIMNLLMYYIITPIATTFNSSLTSILNNMASGNHTVLGAVSAAMMATDMGGPINKAAYLFGTAGIQNDMTDIMAAVMIGGMVPPCGVALSALLFKKKFTEHEIKRAPVTILMGLSFITEGTLPYLITDIIHVMPSCMIGSAAAGALSVIFGCTLLAPHGGIFVFPVVNHPWLYIATLLIGSIITAVILGLTKKKRNAI